MVVFVFRMLSALARLWAACWAWTPTNQLLAWARTPSGIPWGLPIGLAGACACWFVGSWASAHTATGSAWWWLPTVWAAVTTIKFAYLAIRSPFAWIRLTLRRNRESTATGH